MLFVAILYVGQLRFLGENQGRINKIGRFGKFTTPCCRPSLYELFRVYLSFCTWKFIYYPYIVGFDRGFVKAGVKKPFNDMIWGDIKVYLPPFRCLLWSSRKTIEKVIYFMLLERKERSPTHEDAAVATIKNLKEICKTFWTILFMSICKVYSNQSEHEHRLIFSTNQMQNKPSPGVLCTGYSFSRAFLLSNIFARFSPITRFCTLSYGVSFYHAF